MNLSQSSENALKLYVTMIGVSGSGKTSFMSGLENQIQRKPDSFEVGKAGSGSRSTDEIVAQIGKWQSISFFNQDDADGGFAPGTNETTKWEMQLQFKRSDIINFSWIDYRGGALVDFERSRINEKNREIHGIISMSQAVLLFADAHLLTQYEKIKVARNHTGINTIYNILDTISNEVKNLSYVIVLTKSDAVPDEYKENNFAKLKDRGLEAFQEVINLCKHRGWKGGLIPVSATGESVETTMKSEGNWKRPAKYTHRLIDAPDPQNVDIALLYSLYRIIKDLRAWTASELDIIREQIKEAEDKNTPFRELISILTRQERPSEALATLQKEAKVRDKIKQRFNFYLPELKEKIGNEVREIT